MKHLGLVLGAAGLLAASCILPLAERVLPGAGGSGGAGADGGGGAAPACDPTVCQSAGGQCLDGYCTFTCDAGDLCNNVCPPAQACHYRCDGLDSCSTAIACSDDAPDCWFECFAGASCDPQCPPGAPCRISCDGTNGGDSCAPDIGCGPDTTSCRIECLEGACLNVVCQADDCDIACVGGGCSAVDCTTDAADCTIACTRGSCNGHARCRASAACHIDCDGACTEATAESLDNHIDCHDGQDGGVACTKVICSNGPCAITCDPTACGDVDCAAACACSTTGCVAPGAGGSGGAAPEAGCAVLACPAGTGGSPCTDGVDCEASSPGCVGP